jgi:hypothetical protein
LATLARYLQRTDAVPPPQSASFVSVELTRTSASADSGLTLVLSGRQHLRIERGFCPDTLRQVLSVLERG